MREGEREREREREPVYVLVIFWAMFSGVHGCVLGFGDLAQTHKMI